jgi:hypothetical protein
MRAFSPGTALAAALAASAHMPRREEWIALGARVHGGFGAFIPVGIGMGLDALERLQAGQREVTVLLLRRSTLSDATTRS